MSEKDIIESTKYPNTIQTIYENLRNLGIKHGDILLVHSSLSSMGWVCGGAQAVIKALLKVVGEEGTLVMPAHSGDWSDPEGWGNPPVPEEWIPTIYNNMPAYEPELTPTRGMGQIAELFRSYPNSIRSNHPQVSFCANGQFAKIIIDNHLLTPQFGIESPLGNMYHLKVKVLLLGVGYDSCTSFHLAEALISNMPVIKMGTSIMDNGKRVWQWFVDYDYNSDDFEYAGKEFEESFKVQKGMVGNAECRVFDLKEGVDFAKDWIMMHRGLGSR